MKILLFIGSLFFIGCASYVWRHPEHNDQARFNKDAYECERDMRQSGYYGGGLAGALNAQGFQERCMVARGYYKASIESQRAAVPAPPPPPQHLTPIGAGAYQATQLAANAKPVPPTPSVPATSTAPASAPRFAQLYLVKGKIVSTPPQAFTAEFLDDTGKAKVELSGRRVLQGDFELFPFSTSLASRLRLVNPQSIKAISGADAKGLARFTDIGIELECAYSMVSATGRGAGTCADTLGNVYDLVF